MTVLVAVCAAGQKANLLTPQITDEEIWKYVSKDASVLEIAPWACTGANGMTFGFHRWLDASVNHWMPNPAPKGLTFARWEKFLRDYAEKETGRKCRARALIQMGHPRRRVGQIPE